MTRPLFENITPQEAAAAKKSLPKLTDYLMAQSCMALMRGYDIPLEDIRAENGQLQLMHTDPRFHIADGASEVPGVSRKNQMGSERYVIFHQFAEMLNLCLGNPGMAIVHLDFPARVAINLAEITPDVITRSAGKIRGYIADNAPMKTAMDVLKGELKPVLNNQAYQTVYWLAALFSIRASQNITPGKIMRLSPSN